MGNKTFFVTGAEGVGKSTILDKLKEEFHGLDVHDFDEFGVPIKPPLKWRLDTTLHWIKKAIENQEKGISTLILGLCFPEEIKSFEEFEKLDNVVFCLLDINEKEREIRLTKRRASKEVIAYTDSLINLREQIKDIKGEIINVSNLSPDETLEELKEVIV